MIKEIVKFFDLLEEKIRAKLSHYPIIYALIGGIGTILFWRGIWHMADDISMTSGASLIIGGIILLMTGIFVAEFIGNKLIISGLIGEKKISKQEETEIETEENQLRNLQNTLNKLEKKLDHIDADLEAK